MLRKEPTFSSPPVVAESDSAIEVSGNWSFPVRFGVDGQWRKAAPNSFSFYGKGQIHFSKDSVRISGKRHRLFWFGKCEEHAFLRSEIRNARVLGKYVRFEVEHDGKPLQVGFAAASAETAEAVIRLLPCTQSEGFAREHAELVDFHQRLQQLSPRALVTPVLVGLNVLVFVAMALGGAGVLAPEPAVAVQWGSNFGPLTLDGQWWRLLTATFIHFGLLHLVFNMLALYQSGRVVGRMYGSLHFLLLYLVAGLSGSMVSLLWHPGINSAGASGAIFGVLGALLVFMLDKRNGVPGSIMKEQRNSTIAFIAFNLFNGFTHAGIDNGAHLGGLLGGMLMGVLLARPVEVQARVEAGARRLLGGALVALLGLGVLSYPMRHPSAATQKELHFSLLMIQFGAREQAAIDASIRFQHLAAEHKSTDLALAQELEQDVLPRWDALYRDMAAEPLIDNSRQAQLQQALLGYLDSRRHSFQWLDQALRTNDQTLLIKAREAKDEANAQAARIKQLMAKR